MTFVIRCFRNFPYNFTLVEKMHPDAHGSAGDIKINLIGVFLIIKAIIGKEDLN